MGTPAYMAPEQARGHNDQVDQRSDVFGLGAILCEILTGQPPYVGQDLLQLHRLAAAADLGDARARLERCGADTELVELALACLAVKAADRPPSAQAVTDRLKSYLEGVQARLRKAELAEAEARARAGEEARRRRLALALAGTVLLAVVGAAAGGLWLQADRQRRQTHLTREVNDSLARVMELRQQARTATAGSPALFAQAREQARSALALIQTGPADEALKEQVRQVQEQLDEEEKDRKLLAALDAARLAETETFPGQNRFANERAIPLFREAFRAYGLRVGEGEPAAAARLLRQRPAPVREAVNAALDSWLSLAGGSQPWIHEPHLDWLRALAAAESNQSELGEVRAALEKTAPGKRLAVLEKLAAETDARKLPAHTLTRLADWLMLLRSPNSAVDLLRRARRQYPGDFWLNQKLGLALEKVNPPRHAEAIRYLTAAAALRPNSTSAHLNLGQVLYNAGLFVEAIASFQKALEIDPKHAYAHNGLGISLCDGKRDLDGGMACFRQAIALDPKLAVAHYNLGTALKDKGELDEAIACWRKAIALDPKHANAHCNLGNALQGKGKVEEAIACFRKVIEIDPKYAMAHHNLGSVLQEKGQVDEAIACYQKAADLDPRNAVYHYALGTMLLRKGKVDQAIPCFQKAIQLAPQLSQAHCNLGHALKRQGRFAESLAALKRGHELGSKQSGWPYPSNQWVRMAQWLAALETRLPAFLKGEFQPNNTANRMGLVTICRARKLHRAAANLYVDAFSADPKLADDPKAAHRYHAACFAALASAGVGQDTGELAPPERLALRRRALTWLRAELTVHQKALQNGESGQAAAARAALLDWQKNPALIALRDTQAVANLSAEEQQACRRLWTDIQSLRQPDR
jgi:tetratricopeptide (TPR) repeat protein